jgi:clan AA aspartic protease (TIGR02281 family)
MTRQFKISAALVACTLLTPITAAHAQRGGGFAGGLVGGIIGGVITGLATQPPVQAAPPVQAPPQVVYVPVPQQPVAQAAPRPRPRPVAKPAITSTPPDATVLASDTEVPVIANGGGTYSVKAMINGATTVTFAIDSGAADMTMPISLIHHMIEDGAITEADFREPKKYKDASGVVTASPTFLARTVTVGKYTVHDVLISGSRSGDTYLLGQSFLKRFKSWSIDNGRNVLVLRTTDQPAVPVDVPAPVVVAAPPPAVAPAAPVVAAAPTAPVVAAAPTAPVGTDDCIQVHATGEWVDFDSHPCYPSPLALHRTRKEMAAVLADHIAGVP